MRHEGNGNGSPNVEVVRRLEALFREGTAGALSDGQLLGRFAGRRGEEAEAPFAALVERHGPMVLRACRAILRDEHEAQDAFQATFLVLARKARSLWVRDSLGPWLHQVACRTAAAARTAAGRRRSLERRAAEMALRSVVVERAPIDDLGPALHEEVDRLPDRYRRPLVLCYLEGLTHEEAARQLDWPVGTVRSRLARGRERLRGRLVRRGLAPGLALGLGAASSRAEVSNALLESTVRAATRFAAGHATAAGLASATAVALSEGVLRTMFLTKWKLLAAGLVAAGLLATGTAAVARRDGDDPKSQTATAVDAKAKGVEEKAPMDVTAVWLIRRFRTEQGRLQAQKAKVDQLTTELDDERQKLKVIEVDVANLRARYQQVRTRLRGGESLPDDPGAAEAEPKKDEAKAPESKPPSQDLNEDEINLLNFLASQAKLTAEQAKLKRDLERTEASLASVTFRLRGLQTKIRSDEKKRDDAKASADRPVPPTKADEPKSLAAQLEEERAKNRKLMSDLIKVQERLKAPLDGAKTSDEKPRADKAGPRDEANRSGPGDQPGGLYGGKGAKRHYMQISPTLYFATSETGDRVGIYDVEARKAKSIRLPASKEAPLEVVPLIGQNSVALMMKGALIRRLAVFNTVEKVWSTLDLRQGITGRATPIGGHQVVAYVLDHRIYAYSNPLRRWDVLEVPEGIPVHPRVTTDAVTLEFNDRIHRFDAKNGAWDVSPSVREILDSIPDEDDPGPKE